MNKAAKTSSIMSEKKAQVNPEDIQKLFAEFERIDEERNRNKRKFRLTRRAAATKELL